MGKTSERVRGYVSVKGKMHKMSLMDIYYKTVELRTVLCDIARNHKKWGMEWYRLVEKSLFNQAQYKLLADGKDYNKYAITLDEVVEKIIELADLEATMKAMERGDD